MHLADGLPGRSRSTLSLADDELHASAAPRRSRCAAPRAASRSPSCGSPRSFKRDRQKEAASVYRTRTLEHPGVEALYDGGRQLRRRDARGDRAAGPRRLPELPPHAGADARRVRRARLEDRRRVPDPQPDPPGARVHPEVRAGDRRRPAGAPAGGRDEGRRRPGGRPDAAATRPCSTGYYPKDRAMVSRVPGRHALRRPAGGDLARDRPQELRLHALHRRARPRGRRAATTARTTRRRSSRSSSRASSGSRR